LLIGENIMGTTKIKVMTISDHPMLPSGVGTQTKYIIEALLKTGKFQVISLGGAVQHPNYSPAKTQEHGDDWVIYPVDGYGNKDVVRSMVLTHKPDILYFMTDPRFYEWLWEIEDEIRKNVPMVYYHVWDNYPYPTYNTRWYESNDFIATISKVTSDIVQTVAPTVNEQYIPHAVDTTIFKRCSDLPSLNLRAKVLEENKGLKNKVVFFWNNRNARRKLSGSLIWWFKEFLDRVGHDKAALLMHTEVHDQHGQPLDHLIQELGMTAGQVQFSTAKMPPHQLAILYNLADCTINISDAEGFGLATLESLACETPIIVNMTGGLQEQVTDGENFFGVGIEPASKVVIGSMAVPFIYEDRVNKEDFINALLKIYNMTPNERQELGAKGREHVLKNYNFEDYGKTWVETMTKIHETCGSWETRKNYNAWECKEL